MNKKTMSKWAERAEKVISLLEEFRDEVTTELDEHDPGENEKKQEVHDTVESANDDIEIAIDYLQSAVSNLRGQSS